MRLSKKGSAGFSIIEIVVALSVFSIVIFATGQLFLVSRQAASIGKNKIKAYGLALEYLEGVKNIRFDNWEALANGRYLVDSIAGDLSLVPTEGGETVGEFTRYLELEDVYRDENGSIVASGGDLDASTKKATVHVSWGLLRTKEISQSVYLSRYFENLAWEQTTVADFEAGEMDLVKVSDPVIDNGEIELVGGCTSGSPESLIYDDDLENGWRLDCSGLSFWRWLFCVLIQFFSHGTVEIQSSDYAYDDSQYSMRIQLDPPSSGSWWAWARIYNFEGVCTVGFRNLHFYVYNPGATEVEFNVTAVYGEWDRRTVTAPPGGWTEISLDYESIGDDYENNLQSIYFSKLMTAGDPALVIYIDLMELTGGVGGFFTEGTLTSSTFDTGSASAFNRISFTADLPANTEVGFQTAVADSPDGPWVFYGPGGTGLSDDLYTNQAGEGIWLGANLGRYLKYKAYLKSLDGENTPIVRDVTINYSP